MEFSSSVSVVWIILNVYYNYFYSSPIQNHRIIPGKLCFPLPGSCTWTMNDCGENKLVDLCAAGLCMRDTPMYVSDYLYLPAKFTHALDISSRRLIFKPEIADIPRQLENVLEGRKSQIVRANNSAKSFRCHYLKWHQKIQQFSPSGNLFWIFSHTNVNFIFLLTSI